MSAQVLVAEYAVKTFLPVYALSQGVNVAVVGAYFALQEGTHLVLAPLGGRLGDRLGHMPTVALGMAAMAVGLLTLSFGHDTGALVLSAVLIGSAQALVFPSALASVATAVSEHDLGACMGFVGAMKNSAKVAGPILGGVLIHRFGLEVTLASMGVMLIGVALGIYLVWRSGLPTGRFAGSRGRRSLHQVISRSCHRSQCAHSLVRRAPVIRWFRWPFDSPQLWGRY